MSNSAVFKSFFEARYQFHDVYLSIYCVRMINRKRHKYIFRVNR